MSDEDKDYKDYTTFWDTRPTRDMSKQLSSQEIDVYKTDLNIARQWQRAKRCPATSASQSLSRWRTPGPAGHLLALCHWRACRLQALRDPRSILVGEW